MNGWTDLGPRDRRALMIGALILGPVLFVTCGVKPYLRARGGLQDRLQSERALYLRELELVADAERFPAMRERIAKSLDREAERLFGGPNDASATADLAALIASRSHQNEVLLEETRSLPPDTLGGGIVRLAVEFRGMSDLEGTLRFLAALEGGEKLIDVAELHVERREGVLVAATQPVPGGADHSDVGGADASSAAAPAAPTLLSISAVVTGYR